jgi:hypothetical protein
MSGQIWLNLKNNSSFHLPYVLSEGPPQFDLDFLPVPFFMNPNLGDVVFALPESPSIIEYDTAMKVVSYLGVESPGNNFQPGVLLGYPDNVDLSTSHLILIGRPSRNLLLQEVNESLPQPFIPGSDTIRPQIDKIVFRLPDDLDLGYVQLLSSNWNQDQALLAFTGTSDLGVTWATQLVTDPEKNEDLKGNLALARNNSEFYTFDTRELPTGGEVAAISTAVPESAIVGTATPTSVPPTLTPTPLVTSSLVTTLPATPAPDLPEWFPYVVGGGFGLIFIILGIAYWQSHPRPRLRI